VEPAGGDVIEVEIGNHGNPDTDWFNLTMSFSECCMRKNCGSSVKRVACYFVLVDDEDFDHLSQFHWCYRSERNGGQGYAIRHVKAAGKYNTQYLHRRSCNRGQDTKSSS